MITHMYNNSHLKQTIKLAHYSDKEILFFLLDELDHSIRSRGETYELFQNEQVIDYHYENIKQQIQKINETDKRQIGTYIKKLFSISNKFLQINNKENNSTSVMKFMIEKIPDQNVLDILKGANFIVNDNGKLYDFVDKEMDSYGRFSSHESHDMQLGVTNLISDTYLHLLCGTANNKEGEKMSWCQFEGAPMPPGLNFGEVFLEIYNNGNINMEYLQHFIDHSEDAGYYFFYSKVAKHFGKQVFNLAVGSSEYTNKNPLIIETTNMNNEFNENNSDNLEFIPNVTFVSKSQPKNLTHSYIRPNQTLVPENMYIQPSYTTPLLARGGIKRKTKKRNVKGGSIRNIKL